MKNGFKMKIRKYKESETEEIKKMISNVLSEFFGKTVIENWEDFKDYDLFLVAEADKKIVGSIAVKISNGIGNVKRLYVLKEYRNNGLAQKLIDKIFSFCREKELQKLSLFTDKRLEAAKHLYFKNDFKEINDLNWKSNFYNIENEKVDVNDTILMEKTL